MARQENTQLRGRIGNIDFYGRNGGSFAKPASRQCRQTEGTKVQAGVFGKASRLASLLWEHLKPWSAGYANNNAWNRLNRAIADCVRVDGLSQTTPQSNLPFITGFQFNKATSVAERLRFSMQVQRTAEGTVELAIPAINMVQQIPAPARTKTVCLNILALTVSTNNTTLTQAFTKVLQVPYTNTVLPAQRVALPVTTSPAAITLVAIAVAYYTSDNLQLPAVNKPAWMPASIIDGLYN